MSSGSTIVYELNHVLSTTQSWLDPSNIIAAISAAIAFVLLFFAYRTLVKTSEQAQAATTQLALASRPYLSFAGNVEVEYYVGPPDQFRTRIPVKNVGHVPLKYRVTHLEVNGDKIDTTTWKPAAIFPEGETLSSSTPLVPVPSGMTAGAYRFVVIIEIEYWRQEEERKFHIGRTMTITPRGKGIWCDYSDDTFD